MYFTYIIKSLKDEKYYYGSCENLEKRLLTHNTGKVKSTKSRLPFVIHYFEEYSSRAEAQKREYFFKTIGGYRWLKENNIT
jgi:putative endonuclease